MAAEPPRGQLSAWLQKKKSGASLVRVRQYNKRYFTLDFDSRVFFYAHTEGSKQVSSVLPFSELLDVRLPEADISDNTSECSKRSSVSLLRRMSFTGKGEPEQDQHCITLLTRPAKQMELVCASAAEAEQWYKAFKEAIACGSHPSDGEGAFAHQQGEDSDNGSVSPKGRGAAVRLGRGQESAAPSTAAAGYPPARGTGRGAGAGVGGNLALPRAPPPAGAGVGVDAGGGDDSPSSGEGRAAAAGPPTARKNFLDFAAIEEAPAAGKGKGKHEATEVSTTGLVLMQATDFGFGAGEDQSSASSSAPPSPTAQAAGEHAALPRGKAIGHGGRAAAGAAAAGSPAQSRGASGASPTSPGSGARTAYKDRHEGLTLQERLANLEFSEDEDDDEDDPLGLKKSKGR